jgi:outer membrane immunogenic protein
VDWGDVSVFGEPMKKLLLAGVAAGAVAAAGSVNAADIPMPMNPNVQGPPIFSWSGCSIGGHVGWGWSSTTLSDAPGTFSSSALIDFKGFGRSVSVSGNGVLVGGQLGCDYQFNPWFVAGVQASFAGADINGSATDPFALGSALQAKTDFLADVSGRLGFAWDRVLLYGKGGAAWADMSYGFSPSPAAASGSFPAFAASGRDMPFGAVLGAGVEWAFLGNWSAFFEYDHYFFGTDTIGMGPFNLVNVKPEIDAVKAGVNYHFNFWPQPVSDRY